MQASDFAPFGGASMNWLDERLTASAPFTALFVSRVQPQWCMTSVASKKGGFLAENTVRVSHQSHTDTFRLLFFCAALKTS